MSLSAVYATDAGEDQDLEALDALDAAIAASTPDPVPCARCGAGASPLTNGTCLCCLADAGDSDAAAVIAAWRLVRPRRYAIAAEDLACLTCDACGSRGLALLARFRRDTGTYAPLAYCPRCGQSVEC